MVNSHSANEEVILQVAGVVVGQVYHQVNISFADQSEITWCQKCQCFKHSATVSTLCSSCSH